MPPSTASAGTAEPATASAGDLLEGYAAWLQRRGRGNRCYRDAAAEFLVRWSAPQRFAEAPLPVRLAADQHTRPFITFLLLHHALRPGYDYLVARKFAALLELAADSRLAPDLAGFAHAAAELGFSTHIRDRAAERVIARLPIQTGRPLEQLTVADLGELETAFRERAQARGGSWANDRGFLHAAWAVGHPQGHRPQPAPPPPP